MTPLRILALFDRKPGHFRQVEGLVAALGRRLEVRTERLDVRPRCWASEALRRRIARMTRLGPARGLDLLYGIDLAALPAIDVVLACGRPTIAAGILIARARTARLVCLGRAEGYDPAAFAAVVLPYPDGEDRPNRFHAPVPSPIDPTAWPAPRPLDGPEALRGARITLLVGGPATSHRFGEPETKAILKLIEETGRSHGLRWSLSTSRRTPAAAVAAFGRLAADGGLEHFVDYGEAGPGSADALLDADAIVVTEDSLSMIADAEASGRPVVVLAPPRLDRPHIAGLSPSRETAWMTTCDLAGLGADGFVRALAGVRARADRPPDALIERLLPLVRP